MADGLGRAVELVRGSGSSSVSIRRAEINVPNPYTRPASGRFCTVDAEIVDDDPGQANPIVRRLVLLLIVVGVAAIATYAWTRGGAPLIT